MKTPTARLVAMLVFGCLIPVVAAGQDATAPRTAWGAPDLGGVWDFRTITPLERPAALKDKAVLTAEEAAAFTQQSLEGRNADRRDGGARRDIERAYNDFWWDYGNSLTGDNRTSLIVDPPSGRLPTRTETATARLAERAEARRRHARGPEDRSLGERCISWGAPRLGAGYNSYVQLFQTPDHVVVYMEMGGSRVIPLAGSPHVDDKIRQLHGDSRGHWDGDTLVIETTNYSSQARFRGASDNLHMVERLTRVGPRTLDYEVTITDPTTWTRPWTVMIPLMGSDDAIFEYACHEGNIGMEGILAGHRAEERETTAESGSK